MYLEKLDKINFQESINKENVVISEYDNNDICWFKCKIKTDYINLLDKIKDKQYQKKINPLLLDIIEKENIFYYNLKSPAPLLGIPEQNFIFRIKEKDNIIYLYSVETENIFEDSDTNKIEYFQLKFNNGYAEIYTVIKPSQLLPGNKHVVYLRNFLFYFLKSLQ